MWLRKEELFINRGLPCTMMPRSNLEVFDLITMSLERSTPRGGRWGRLAQIGRGHIKSLGTPRLGPTGTLKGT